MKVLRLSFCFALNLHYLCTDKRNIMQRWLKILLVVVTLSTCGITSVSASGHTTDDGKRKQGDMLVEQQDNRQAVLSNANELAHLCCSRPERVIPSSSNFYNTLRTPAKPNTLFHLQKASFCHYRGLGVPISRRIAAMPSSAYYVLTLRRLIC